MEIHVVRVQQESREAGLNERPKAIDVEEHTKKIGAINTEVQNNAEVFDAIKKDLDSQDLAIRSAV